MSLGGDGLHDGPSWKGNYHVDRRLLLCILQSICYTTFSVSWCKTKYAIKL